MARCAPLRTPSPATGRQLDLPVAKGVSKAPGGESDREASRQDPIQRLFSGKAPLLAPSAGRGGSKYCLATQVDGPPAHAGWTRPSQAPGGKGRRGRRLGEKARGRRVDSVRSAKRTDAGRIESEASRVVGRDRRADCRAGLKSRPYIGPGTSPRGLSSLVGSRETQAPAGPARLRRGRFLHSRRLAP
jgi:hypothetical protein